MTRRALEHLNADAVMARIIREIGPITLRPRRLPPFQSLVQAIVHQQLSGGAAAAILRRFLALFGTGDFPSASAVAALDVDALRSAGLSRAKARCIRHLAELAGEGSLPSFEDCQELPDAALIERLTAIKGIGRWTVEMLLIFNFGRPDVLPTHDLGVRRGFQLAYRRPRLPEPAEVQRLGLRWSPYRTTAALYLWRAANMLKDGEW